MPANGSLHIFQNAGSSGKHTVHTQMLNLGLVQVPKTYDHTDS